VCAEGRIERLYEREALSAFAQSAQQLVRASMSRRVMRSVAMTMTMTMTMTMKDDERMRRRSPNGARSSADLNGSPHNETVLLAPV